MSHIESASDPGRFGDELTCGVEYDSLAAPPVVAGAEGDLKATTRESPICTIKQGDTEGIGERRDIPM
jgi:hypothetical protein